MDFDASRRLPTKKTVTKVNKQTKQNKQVSFQKKCKLHYRNTIKMRKQGNMIHPKVHNSPCGLFNRGTISL
jgi:hypothetical protein